MRKAVCRVYQQQPSVGFAVCEFRRSRSRIRVLCCSIHCTPKRCNDEALRAAQTATAAAFRRSLSERRKKEIAYRQQYKCASCSVLLPPTYDVDHVKPIAMGGHNGNSNLQALCRECHKRKTQKDLLSIRDSRKSKISTTEKGNGACAHDVLPVFPEFRIKMNAAQSAAVTDAHNAAIRVHAGPGTGKTAVLTARVAHLISNLDVAPQHILTLTFTNRAAREMRKRISSTVGPAKAERVTMGTFHSVCLYMLRRDINLLRLVDEYESASIDHPFNPYRRGFGVYDEKESVKAISTIIAKDLQWERADFPPSEMQTKISAAKNSGLCTAYRYSQWAGHCPRVLVSTIPPPQCCRLPNNATMLMSTRNIHRPYSSGTKP